MPDIDTQGWKCLRSWSEDFGGTGSDYYRVEQDPANPARFVVRRSGVACGWDVDECHEIRAPDRETHREWEENPRHVRYAIQQEGPKRDPWKAVTEWVVERVHYVGMEKKKISLGSQAYRLYQSSQTRFMGEKWDPESPDPGFSCWYVTFATKEHADKLLADPKKYFEENER